MKFLSFMHRWPLLVAFLFVATCATLAVAAPPDKATLQRQLDELLASRSGATGPGVVLLVARGDELLYRGARGQASVELAVPLSPDQAFRIGSVTKQFAATTLLKLVDEGRAQLADPLSKYLPDFPNGQAITLAQLLNHTSGVKSYTGIPGYMEQPIRRDLSTTELVATFRGLPVDFAPGARWAYNNSGYVLVGAVIEAITKQPWHEAVLALARQHGLQRTWYGDHSAVIPGMADGYTGGPGGTLQRAGLISMTQPHAAGALVSTVDDLWRWNLALHRGRVLSPESYRRMTTPEGEPATAARYGYGIATGTLRGQPLRVHTGGIHGYVSALLWLPEQQLTVAALRNSDGGLDLNTLARQAAALALGDPYPDGPAVAVPAGELQKLTGRWRRGNGDEVQVRLAGDSLTVQGATGSPRRLRALGEGRFGFERSLSRVEFDTVKAGSARFYADGEGPGESWSRIGD